MVSANNSTSAGGLASAETGIRPIRWGAIQLMAARSVRTDRGDRGALNFYHYILTGSKGGGVHLGDGGGGQRLAVEAAEDLLERGARDPLPRRPVPLRRARAAPGRGGAGTH